VIINLRIRGYYLGLYFAFIGRLLLKDFRDVKGDQLYGKKTFLLCYGAKITCLVSGFFWVVGTTIICIAVVLPYPVLALFVLGLIQSTFLLNKLSTSNNTQIQQNYIKSIANVANALILTLIIFLITRNLTAFFVGFTLLSINLFRYKTSDSKTKIVIETN
jgi:4-hydroxybenzoate polyprenyltransferase